MSDKERAEGFLYLNLGLLIIYSVPAFYLLVKSRMNLDLPALINILIYMMSFLLLTILWGLADWQPVLLSFMTLVEYFAVFTIEISLYFFVFEVQSVQAKLISRSHTENQDRQRRIRRNRLIATGAQAGVFAGLLFFYVRWNIVKGGEDGDGTMEVSYVF